ncbi:uncharacterized protein [Epargyreus clarus]|uniref:uncharacterized protein n=1 Tax=Epargyreus clarus TaxID=520877 RepID=UPI003C2FEB16
MVRPFLFSRPHPYNNTHPTMLSCKNPAHMYCSKCAQSDDRPDTPPPTPRLLKLPNYRRYSCRPAVHNINRDGRLPSCRHNATNADTFENRTLEVALPVSKFDLECWDSLFLPDSIP